MKNYIYLLLISSIAIIGVLVAINLIQVSILPVLVLFLIGLILTMILLAGNKKISHIIEQVELLFMFGVFVGLLYAGYTIFTTGIIL
ncbi:hypothetical protein [Methanococcus aeolicus]|jgi:energy-converting hydrogenase A subunit K|uniref:Uncharacterized protein n=1 Tax=Methanococcus aeolicus (strain ATCC BAA-1280 / DSM 17508 / OCM 812 / Nankai-3) TaxID=419665 RepID=A6UTY2_META3|nr:hypothetical protein [Methanococcus aeolicus]ABR55954.1 conserved hypothetical protein [Methanococcus aeolicus Nankai-3]UXM85448.1 hypothetical protein N6C89_04020 [Methanococcus aeolicus]